MCRSALRQLDTSHVALPAFLAVTLLFAAIPPALASPQPDPVCGACGPPFEGAADEEGLTVNVTNSTATVHVHANGSATWVVTNRVNNAAADRLRADSAMLDRIADRAATSGWGSPGGHVDDDAEFTSASINDQTVTIRYLDTKAGQRHAGVLVVDYLHSEGVGGGWMINADRFTIVGPPGTTVVNDPRAAIDREYAPANAVPIVDRRRVTWHGSTQDAYRAIFRDDVYVVFGDAGTPAWRVDAALALATAPIWIDNVQTFVFPAVVVYGVLLLGVAVATRRFAPADADPDPLAKGVTALGGIGVVAGLLAPAVGHPGWFAGVAAVYLVTGIAAVVRPAAFRSPRWTLGVGIASLVGATAVLGGSSLIEGSFGFAFGAYGNSFVSTLRGGIAHLPLTVAPAFGVALAAGGPFGSRRAQLGAFAGALVSLAIAGGVFVPIASRPFGLIIIFTIGAAVLAALFGLPLAVLAARQVANPPASGVADDAQVTAAD